MTNIATIRKLAARLLDTTQALCDAREERGVESDEYEEKTAALHDFFDAIETGLAELNEAWGQ